MRDLRLLEVYRRKLDGWDNRDPKAGFFVFKSPTDGAPLRAIVSAGLGWDHVSVSRTDRIPTWLEMEWMRRKFFEPEEFAFQYHAPIADYVDGTFKGNCPTCLHLWRPWEAENFPTPPKWMVGGMTEDEGEFQMRMHEADRRKKGLPL